MSFNVTMRGEREEAAVHMTRPRPGTYAIPALAPHMHTRLRPATNNRVRREREIYPPRAHTHTHKHAHTHTHTNTHTHSKHTPTQTHTHTTTNRVRAQNARTLTSAPKRTTLSLGTPVCARTRWGPSASPAIRVQL
jgi:hypothetical protein